MSTNVHLLVLFIVVIVCLSIGLFVAVRIGSLADGAVFAFGGGLGMLLVTFGCCVAAIGLGYGGVMLVDRALRRRAKAERAQRKAEARRSPKKRRKRK